MLKTSISASIFPLLFHPFGVFGDFPLFATFCDSNPVHIIYINTSSPKAADSGPC